MIIMMARVIFTISVTIYKIFTNKMCMILTFKIGKIKFKCVSQRPYMISYLMTIVMFALSNTIYEIFAYQIKWKKSTLKIKVEKNANLFDKLV